MAPRARAFAALALGWARASAAPSQDGTFEVADALEVDDQCAAGDDCALKALQLRGTLLDPEADSDAPGEGKVHAAAARRHHHHPDIRDLDPHLKKEYVGKIKDLALNISSMDYKMAYLSEDLESAKLRLYGVPNAPEGVNGTVVDWSKHPGAWLPFDMPEAVEPGSGAAADGADSKEVGNDDDDDDDDDDDEDGDDDAAGPPGIGPPPGGLPPSAELELSAASGKRSKQRRLKKVQKLLKYQQLRLAVIWGQMGYLTGNLTMLNEYIAQRPRTINGILVLAETDKHEGEEEMPAFVETRERVSTNRRRRTEAQKEEEMPKPPEEQAEDQLNEAQETVDKVWDSFASIGMKTEAVKRRVEMWVRGMPPAPYAASEDLPAPAA
mmetsp:Transcript_11283/g.32053  ORF Transcript_11283/g.32053 Transcript_11283/m.32053 type:complete len:382 (-) Transcript_11283:106-1251(-)